MPTTLAFLRAINLGARRKFPKEEIVAATEAAGFTEVATHINTGNVRFTTRMRSRERIEAALETAYLERTGFEVPTVVLAPAELHRIVADADWLQAARLETARLEETQVDAGFEGAHYVSLLKDEPDPGLAADVEALGGDDAVVRVRERAVHLLVAGPYHESRLTNATVEKRLGVATNRNLTVLRAIAQKWC